MIYITHKIGSLSKEIYNPGLEINKVCNKNEKRYFRTITYIHTEDGKAEWNK
jgi:hypothetical protein